MKLTRNIGISVILTLVLKATLVTCFCVCCLHDIGVKIQLHTEGENCPEAQHQTNAEHCSSGDCMSYVSSTNLPFFLSEKPSTSSVEYSRNSCGALLSEKISEVVFLEPLFHSTREHREISRPVEHRFIFSSWQWSC